MTPLAGLRSVSAICNARSTKLTVMRFDIAQPTTKVRSQSLEYLKENRETLVEKLLGRHLISLRILPEVI